MFRMWGKLMKSNRLLKDTVISVENAGLNRTRKVYKALEDICYEFDLPKPLWLEANKKEFMTTVLLKISTLISWRSRLSKKTKAFRIFL